MVLQNKHKKLASSRYKKAHGINPKSKLTSADFPELARDGEGSETPDEEDEDGSGDEEGDEANGKDDGKGDGSVKGPQAGPSGKQSAKATGPPFRRRQLKSNAYRYEEEEKDPYLTDEEEEHDQATLAEFVNLQKTKSSEADDKGDQDEDVDLDVDIGRLLIGKGAQRKGKVTLKTREELDIDSMATEISKADAVRALKSRFLTGSAPQPISKRGGPRRAGTTGGLRQQTAPPDQDIDDFLNELDTGASSTFGSRDAGKALPSDDIDSPSGQHAGEDFLDQVLDDPSATFGRRKRL